MARTAGRPLDSIDRLRWNLQIECVLIFDKILKEHGQSLFLALYGYSIIIHYG